MRWFDGDGLCLFAKRLDRGRFVWPKAESGPVFLSRAQLSMLLEGIDWRRPERSFTPRMPSHLKREAVTHAPEHDCSPDCGCHSE
jgi:transposase